MTIPYILYALILGVVVAAHVDPWNIVALLAFVALSLMSMAIRLDYIQVISKPEHLKTWTMDKLYLAVSDEPNTYLNRAVYVEGTDAYHPINGAFLARIGDAPAIVLQLTKEPHA